MSYFALTAPPGIVSDDTTFASQGRWADGNNVRFYQGFPQTIGGVASPSNNGPYLSVTKMMAYSVSGTIGIAAAGQSLTRIIPGVADIDITPTGWVGGGRHSLAKWGDVLLASNHGGKLFQSIAGATASHITQAPAKMTSMLVTATRQVMALGCNEVVSGVFNGRAIRISHTEDLTEWIPAADNLSDEVVLDGQGSIVGGCLLGEHVVIWTNDAMYLGSFTGDPTQPWRFDRVANVGMVGLDAFAVRGATVYFMAPDLRVYVYAPGQEPLQLQCAISREFTAHIDPAHRDQTSALHNSRFGEIWFFYSDLRGGSSPSRYIAFAVSETEAAQRPVWFRGEALISAAVDDPLLAEAFAGYNTSIAVTMSLGGPYMLWRYDCGGLQRGATPWHIQSADQYFDESERRILLRSITPDFEAATDGGGVGEVALTLFVRGQPQESPLTKGPFMLTAATGKQCCRCSGKIVAARFSAADGQFMRLGKPLFDIVPLGER
jgi:hypothetical protein